MLIWLAFLFAPTASVRPSHFVGTWDHLTGFDVPAHGRLRIDLSRGRLGACEVTGSLLVDGIFFHIDAGCYDTETGQFDFYARGRSSNSSVGLVRNGSAYLSFVDAQDRMRNTSVSLCAMYGVLGVDSATMRNEDLSFWFDLDLQRDETLSGFVSVS
jgi:hypothetical protein